MYIDAHSHRATDNTQILVNVHTRAIHPWDLLAPFDREAFELGWELLKQEKSIIYAIGECGLDRVHEGIADIKDQVYVLEKHFELAQTLRLPIILHTVRAFSDLLHILKKSHFNYPIMLHAYGGNEYEMYELLKYPVYFTYGKRLFNNDKMLKLTPLDRLLLETGDQAEFSIADIYKKAAGSLGIKLEDLEKQLEKNFLTFFSKLDDISSADFIQDLNTRKTR